jgi:hypothetical protein
LPWRSALISASIGSLIKRESPCAQPCWASIPPCRWRTFMRPAVEKCAHFGLHRFVDQSRNPVCSASLGLYSAIAAGDPFCGLPWRSAPISVCVGSLIKRKISCAQPRWASIPPIAAGDPVAACRGEVRPFRILSMFWMAPSNLSQEHAENPGLAPDSRTLKALLGDGMPD